MHAPSVPPTALAAVTVGHGGPEMVRIEPAWPVPTPTARTALIEVSAAALNNTDIWSRQGAYGTSADPDAIAGWKGVPLVFPRVQGIDVVGRVAAVGPSDAAGADHWLGRRVMVDPTARYQGGFPVDIIGSERDGGFGQYCLVDIEQLHDVEVSPLSDDQLACLPTAYGTAMGMINRAGCRPGERVLVTGSSGGVGSAAIGLLLARGCVVIAHTSAAKVDSVRALGPTEITVRDTNDLPSLAPVDAVVDVVGGPEFGQFVDALRTGGRLVTAGAIAGPVVSLDIRRLYLGQRTLIGSTMHTKSDFAELAAVANRGEIKPVVAATFPLAELEKAQARFEAKDFTGKLVVNPWAK